MKEQIKKLRKALNLTQQEFADEIGVSRNNIAAYETGKSNPGDAAIALICRTFKVNNTWLRSGEGKMFIQQSKEEEIAAIIERFLSGERADFKKRLITALASIKEEHWEILEKLVYELASPQPSSAPLSRQESLTIDEQVALYRAELEAKEKAIPCAASTPTPNTKTKKSIA